MPIAVLFNLVLFIISSFPINIFYPNLMFIMFFIYFYMETMNKTQIRYKPFMKTQLLFFLVLFLLLLRGKFIILMLIKQILLLLI